MSTDNYEVRDDEYYLDGIEDSLDWRHRIKETDDENEEKEDEGIDDDQMFSMISGDFDLCSFIRNRLIQKYELRVS